MNLKYLDRSSVNRVLFLIFVKRIGCSSITDSDNLSTDHDLMNLEVRVSMRLLVIARTMVGICSHKLRG